MEQNFEEIYYNHLFYHGNISHPRSPLCLSNYTKLFSYYKDYILTTIHMNETIRDKADRCFSRASQNKHSELLSSIQINDAIPLEISKRLLSLILIKSLQKTAQDRRLCFHYLLTLSSFHAYKSYLLSVLERREVEARI